MPSLFLISGCSGEYAKIGRRRSRRSQVNLFFFIALKLKLESWCDGAMAELYSGSANTFSGTWANRNLIVCRGFQVLIISSSVGLDILTHNTRQEYRQK